MTQPDTTKGYQLSFKVFHGGELTRAESLSGDSITIGRSSSNIIPLEDSGIADVHAVVKVTRDKRLMLTDLDSDEGTFVGDARVDSRIQLTPGTRIRIGPYDIQVDLIDLSRIVATPALDADGEVEEDAEEARLLDLSADDVVHLLFKAWDSQDRLGIDNRQAPKLLEMFEIWSDTILSARTFPKTASAIRLGDDHRSRPDFFIDRKYLPSAPFSLVAQHNNTLCLQVGSGFTGELYQNGQMRSFADVIRSGGLTQIGDVYLVPLSEDSRFVLHFGHIVLTGAFSHPAKRPMGAGSFDVDGMFLGLLLLIGLLFGTLTGYMTTLEPPPPMTLSQIPDQFAKILLPKKEELKQEQKKIEIQVNQKKDVQATPVPTKEVEDRGKKDSKVKISKADRVALDQAAVDKKAADRALAGLIGNSGLDKGFGPDVSKAAAGLLATTGNSNVLGVSGSRGVGFSGGEGAGGIGQIGTKGGGGGDGYGDSYGVAKRKKESANIDVGLGDALVLGALDKSVIERVIKDHITQIRYCYQRELPKNPRLAGKVVVKFIIDGQGNVSQANTKETSMGSPAVEDCVNQRILQLKFPEPKGGGTVSVSYPFFFKAAG